jgi:Ca2+-binding EF-hand superfamily protein
VSFPEKHRLFPTEVFTGDRPMSKPIVYATLALLTLSCHADEKDSSAVADAENTSAVVAAPALIASSAAMTGAATSASGAAMGGEPSITVPGVGSCSPDSELTSTVQRVIGMADENGDGQISKEEATTVANFLIGGFFFRADTNGDGTVTPEEGRQERAKFVSEHPAVAGFFERATRGLDGHPFASVAQVLDASYGQPLTIAEARAAVHTGVDDLFRVADSNHDGKLSQAEMRAVALDGVRAGEKAMFQSADTDHSGGLSLAEFQSALQTPEKIAFDAADLNKDGQLTQAEAAQAANTLVMDIQHMGITTTK